MRITNLNNQIDSLDAIKKLGELKEMGLVTEEEFEEKKKLILMKDKHEVFASIQEAKESSNNSGDQWKNNKSSEQKNKKNFFFSPFMMIIYFFCLLYWSYYSSGDTKVSNNSSNNSIYNHTTSSSSYKNTLSKQLFNNEGVEWPFYPSSVDFICYRTTPFIFVNNIYYPVTGKGQRSHRQPSGEVSETFAVDIMKGETRSDRIGSSGAKLVDKLTESCLRRVE